MKMSQAFRYWTEVFDTISQVFMISRDPIICLFGALEEESLSPYAHTAVLHLLYTARKRITRYWIVSHVPTRQQ